MSNFQLTRGEEHLGREVSLNILATMPRRCAIVLRRLGSLHALAAFIALASGFCLVSLVLIVAFPLVALVAFGRTALNRLFDMGSRVTLALSAAWGWKAS